MATSSSVIRKGKLDELRHEILSYKPGKAVPCDDDRVVFPDTLVIVLNEEIVRDFARKVGCHVPICVMETTGDSKVLEKAKNKLKKLGVTDIYDIAPVDGDLSDEKRLQWLHLLHGCLKKGDEGISADLIQLYSLPSFERLWNQVKEAQTRHGEEIKEGEEAKKLLRGRITDLEQELNESRESRTSIVSENGRLQDTIKVEQERHEHSERAMVENEKRATQIMETYKQREMEFEEKLQSKDLRIETMAEKLQGTEKKARRQVERLETENEEMMTKLVSKLEEKERKETTLRQQVEELKKGREGDRAGAEKEKRSLAIAN
ncbi:caldesmon-like [Strongylocentrotus purpuratus]|uniref:Uncharacterized protein n=1 Tax=Strongylocentrotus purpuratus TaxID=7668 RepID=A0A7M7SVR9_STRPU|nr:caldesmon-like [Strongylocentrotus purpuratus]